MKPLNVQTARLIGLRINSMLVARNMSEAYLARRLALRPAELRRILKGQHAPMLFTLRLIAREMRVNVTDIVSCLDEAPVHASARGAGGQGVDASANREDARQAQESLVQAAPGHVGS